jgi:hypothetical protein
MHEICLIPNNNLLIWEKKEKKSGAQALSKQAKKKTFSFLKV